MKISIGICTHNEGNYINELLSVIKSYVEHDKSGVEWEIVIVDDDSTDSVTLSMLDKFKSFIKLYKHNLNKDYATHKNFLNSKCTGDWIFNLDADEFVTPDILGFIPTFIELNPSLEAAAFPRINTVEGITHNHLRQYGWVTSRMEEYVKIKHIKKDSDEFKLLKDLHYITEVDEQADDWMLTTFYQPIIMYPDYQFRLYKNIPTIKWINKVHERLVGYNHFGMIPQGEVALAIQHHKHIARQEQQNKFYSTI